MASELKGHRKVLEILGNRKVRNADNLWDLKTGENWLTDSIMI